MITKINQGFFYHKKVKVFKLKIHSNSQIKDKESV